MNEIITKEDLRQLSLLLLDKIQILINEAIVIKATIVEPQWIKSKVVRKMLDLSAGSVQNLRVAQKVRFKKVMGSYYYNKEDLQKLFSDEQ